MPSTYIFFNLLATAAGPQCPTVHTVALYSWVFNQVGHFQMAGIYVGSRTFHAGLVYEVVESATVDTRL